MNLPEARRLTSRLAALWIIVSLFTTNALPADIVLFDFSSESDLRNIAATDANATGAQPHDDWVLRVTTGVKEKWPGITLRARAGQWDLSSKAYITLRLKNTGRDQVTVNCRADNAGADGTKNCLTGSITLRPGQTDTLRVALKTVADDKLGGRLFGMRGYPVATGGPGTIDTSRVTQLVVYLNNPKAEHVFEIQDIRATGSYVRPTAWTNDADPFFPFIDTFGQYSHKSWPGKVLSVEDLAKHRTDEQAVLNSSPGPKNWDKYGGYASGPLRKATGFFRTEKIKDKWWLVDPDGRLFFSHGVDCVRMLDATAVEERETWFVDFPGQREEFKSFFGQHFALKGHYANRTVKCFSFAAANLQRKYGSDWQNNFSELLHKRLRSWGLNTIGNWSDERTYLLRCTPYTDAVSSGNTKMIEGSEGYWGKFPDVFDPTFAEGLRRSIERKKGKSAGDPWCIGYFSDNEMSWGDETSISLAALRSPPTQAAKQAFIEDLKGKYSDISRLNEKWGTKHESWDALLQTRETPDKERAKPDLVAFYGRAAEQYFKTVRETIKSVAPNQLYLGCRFAWVNARAATASAKYCDVVSYNIYKTGVNDFEFNGAADVPLMIGEFHFGALDRGMFHTGLVPVSDQAARAQAYKDYVTSVLRHPQFVGCHWFQYQDEPTTGRVLDEENYQIGLVDIADTPYAETIKATRAMGDVLYSR